SRLNRDVLAQPGARTVILLEGINDIAFSHFNTGNLPPGVPLECFLPNDVVSAAQIISGYQQIIARVHAAGLRILSATLTPYQGSAPYTDAGEATPDGGQRLGTHQRRVRRRRRLRPGPSRPGEPAAPVARLRQRRPSTLRRRRQCRYGRHPQP